MEVWQIIFLSNWVLCRFHVNLPGCIRNCLVLSLTRKRGSKNSSFTWSSIQHVYGIKTHIHISYLPFFPERRVEGRFLGAVSLSSMTSLAWFKLLNLNLLDLTCLTWTCLTKTFLISLSWLDLGKLLTWLAKPTCFTWLAKLTCLTDLFNWLALLTCFTDLLYWLSLLDLLNWLALLTCFTDFLYWLALLTFFTWLALLKNFT